MSSFQFPLNVLSDGCFVATNKTGIMLKPHFKVRSCEISENKNHKHKTVAANFCCGFYPFELFGYFLTLLCIRAAWEFEHCWASTPEGKSAPVHCSVEITNDLPGSPISNIQVFLTNRPCISKKPKPYLTQIQSSQFHRNGSSLRQLNCIKEQILKTW